MTSTAWSPFGGVRLRDRWTDIFRSHRLVHVLLMAAVGFGAIQGWLKDRVPGLLPYVLSDGCFALALFLWFAHLATAKEPLLIAPRGTRSDLILLVLVLMPFAFILMPTPLMVSVAGLRAWSFFPLACLMGLTMTRSAGQVRAHLGFLLVMCVGTGVYGIRQYLAGPEAALATEFGAARHGGSVFYYLPGSGETDFRAFSTFTYPAPFAAFMVFGTLIALGVAVSRERPPGQRVLAALLAPLLFVAMTLSGTRAALLTLLAGLLVMAWLRGVRPAQVLGITLMLGAAHLATLLTSGRSLARFRTIFETEGLLWSYVTQPLKTAAGALAEHPIGLGLGRTGIGVPFFLTSQMPRDYFVFSDGDTGRAAIEMGVLGILWLGLVVFGLLPRVVQAARQLSDSPAADVAFGAGALTLSTGVVILIGSPLSATPHALIWWFLFGALIKLAILDEERRRAEAGAAETGPEPPAAVVPVR